MIGKENLIVQRFVPESWSIIHDFMHEIGMDVTSEFQELEENIFVWIKIRIKESSITKFSIGIPFIL